MDNLTDVLDALAKELLAQIKDLGRCKNREEKRAQAETVHLLSQSLGSLISSTTAAMATAHGCMDDEYLDEDYLDDLD